jgi:hypothetical protein
MLNRLAAVGIDVQAELRLRNAASSCVAPGQQGSLVPKQSTTPLELSRNLTQRPGPGIAPKLEQLSIPPQHRDGVYSVHSPKLQPTPPSHVSSPTNGRSPAFALQGAMPPKGGDFQAQQQQQHSRPSLLPQARTFPSAPQMGIGHSEAMDAVPSQPVMCGNAMTSRLPSAYYPSPFQKHYDQLGKLTRLLFPVVFRGAMFVLD